MSSVVMWGAAHLARPHSGPRIRPFRWAPVISALRPRFRLVLIDNRGSGRSTTADRNFTVADIAVDVTAVLDRSQIAHAHVLGASLGGMVTPRRSSGGWGL
jgi:pimeloyl-ACP methyl ester carboxylesterase